MTSRADDGIVVVGSTMTERQTVYGYLSGPETLRRREFVWGMVREPPAPLYGHQAIVTRTTVLLDGHVRAHDLGRICVAPVDVVLDEENALVLQPDVVFVSHARADIVRDQIWGAPDLVIEVLSPGTRRRDSTYKVRWYRRYGVREYWLIDPHERTIRVMWFPASGRVQRRRFRGDERVTSEVLPAFETCASAFFE